MIIINESWSPSTSVDWHQQASMTITDDNWWSLTSLDGSLILIMVDFKFCLHTDRWTKLVVKSLLRLKIMHCHCYLRNISPKTGDGGVLANPGMLGGLFAKARCVTIWHSWSLIPEFKTLWKIKRNKTNEADDDGLNKPKRLLDAIDYCIFELREDFKKITELS